MGPAGRPEQTIVVGAGVAGLACARALADAGLPVLVLERARGIGGRCATRHVEAGDGQPGRQPVDFGVLFLHARDPELLAALEGVPATPLHGWPRVVQGAGRPCQPQAFAPGERRLAFAEGVSVFPKHLAQGLDVRLGAKVISFSLEDGAVRLDLEGEPSTSARRVVLALATEQVLALLHASPETAPALSTARELLSMVRSQPCLTVIAGYPLDAPAPPWDVCYPEHSGVLQILAHDSAKRASPAFRAMVYQAHPRWSREHLTDASHAGGHPQTPGWPEAMLAEAAQILGPWAAQPRFVQAHRWRHARTDLGAELCAPLYLPLPGGARLGITGELFAPGGGVSGAFTAGRRMARRILAEENR